MQEVHLPLCQKEATCWVAPQRFHASSNVNVNINIVAHFIS